jgi:hypothetical protein
LPPATSYTATPRISGTVSDAAIQSVIESLVSDVATTVSSGTAPTAETLPSLVGYSSTLLAARSTLVAEKADIQQDFLLGFNGYDVLRLGEDEINAGNFSGKICKFLKKE